MFALIGWAFGELVVEPLRRRRLRALVARPVVQVEEVPMRKVEVRMVVTFADDVTLEGRAEVLRRMRLEGLQAGAKEISAWSKEPAGPAVDVKAARS